jgi:hypothetical protein
MIGYVTLGTRNLARVEAPRYARYFRCVDGNRLDMACTG